MGIEEKIELLETGHKALSNKIVELESKLQQQQKEKTFTVKEAAKSLSLTPSGVNYHIRKGNLKAMGKRCKKICEYDLLRFMKDINLI
ncbi:MAG TPA: hypothetical protein VF411_02060 [Bacteroidia bacterium]